MPPTGGMLAEAGCLLQILFVPQGGFADALWLPTVLALEWTRSEFAVLSLPLTSWVLILSTRP